MRKIYRWLGIERYNTPNVSEVSPVMRRIQELQQQIVLSQNEKIELRFLKNFSKTWGRQR